MESEENSLDETVQFLSKSVIEEENKIYQENDKAEEDARVKYKKESDEELKEKRYQRLLHLLKNSELYTSALKENFEAELGNKNIDKCVSSSNILEETNIQEMSKQPFEVKEEAKTNETYINSMGFSVPINQPKLLEGGALRDYQIDGLQWVLTLFERSMSGILADEMGLGKTIQVIAIICKLIENGAVGPFLVIAPLSTIPNWLIEFQTFAPKVPTLLFHGKKHDRPGLAKKIKNRTLLLNRKIYPVVITSYEIPLVEKKVLSGIKWTFLVIDEGHKIKNHHTQLARAVREFKSLSRLLLTGTPLQNNLIELWALLNFVLPEMFENYDVFESWFQIEEFQNGGETVIEQEKKKQIISKLHQIFRPFLLRRSKTDVALNLPPKKEVLVYCPLTQLQRQLYEATVDHHIEKIHYQQSKSSVASLIIPSADGKKRKRKCVENRKFNYTFSDNYEDDVTEDIVPRKSVSAVTVEDKENSEEYIIDLLMTRPHMQLRKIVNHPYLIQFPVIPGTRDPKIDEDIVNKCGKFLVLDAMLEKLKASGHKVLIFSGFKMVLDLLEEHAIMRKYKYCRLDGNCSMEDRQESIKAFNTDPEIFTFFMTTRAGGLGINLTAADTVIIYDSDWNPQADLQAQDRCHRIGQHRPVVVYRFCVAGTVEEQMIQHAARKRRLEKIILQNGKFNLNPFKSKPSTKLDLFNLTELRKLLKSSDHHHNIHSNGFVFTDKELEVLLDRSDMIANLTPQVKALVPKEELDQC